SPSRSAPPALVCLFQRGGADGLHMVIPHGDPIYYRERPRIAVPRQDVIDLDGYFGLHPELAALKPWWDNQCLAVVHAVGSPDPTRSHVEAQDCMETGTPGAESSRDGWLNRYCRHHPEARSTPFRAVALGHELPRALAGTARALVLEHVDAAPCRPEHGAEYPPGRLGRALLRIAQLLKADLGLEIAWADVGGWDTHVNQGSSGGPLALRLRELGRGLAAFARDLGERMDRVVVLTLSEFGRTVPQNATAGTDHGRATAMLVLGGPVRGGAVRGRWPGLDPADRVEGRSLAVTTDFRDLVGEVLVRHLGAADAGAVFPGYGARAERFPGVIRA
ncbi:MAG TPA: DUF1501 domain-containing protein, partial [Gemmatimonadales bacterium]|nr:DUF1501 domain-containing protein [Gemmatimonadales bacterium]